MGHAIGLYHEQSRLDRGNFVTINWNEITAGQSGNFQTYIQSNRDGRDVGSYNLSSIMQYSSFQFSGTGNMTIVSNQPQTSCGSSSTQICPNRWLHEWDATNIYDLYQQVAEVGIAAAKSDGRVYTWYKDGVRSVGTLSDAAADDLGDPISLPNGYSASSIRGVAISGSDEVFMWYSNGRRSRGSSTSQSSSTLSDVTYPSGYSAVQLVGVTIRASDDHVFFYFADGEYCQGTSIDACYYSSGPGTYTLPPGYSPADIIGMARGQAANGNRVYTWYRDGARSTGTASDLDYFGFTPAW
jgi:hypothetical protein